MNKVNALFSLIRFELPFSAGICVVMGQLLALGFLPSWPAVLLGFLSVFSISSSILVLNDYFDLETDKINAPDRPLPSNKITMTEALMLAFVLLFAGLLFSYLLGIAAFFCALFLSLIGFLYNRFFKKSGLPGNLMVSFSVGMTFIYGGISVGLPFNKLTWFFGLIAGLIDLGEEIAADAMDAEGDKLIHSNSLAIKFGKDAALNISGLIFLLVILLSILPFVLDWFGMIYLIAFLVMDAFIIYSTLKLLIYRDERGRIYIRRLYLGATLGIVIFILIRLFGI
ncbi:MAG: UbiA family prenyltransferase [Calditrichaceae bacterium]